MFKTVHFPQFVTALSAWMHAKGTAIEGDVTAEVEQLWARLHHYSEAQVPAVTPAVPAAPVVEPTLAEVAKFLPPDAS